MMTYTERIITVSKIELDHILGSLRMPQRVMEGGPDYLLGHVHEVLTDGDSHGLMTDDEINDLCLRINTEE
jgi:hypothetical protein